MFGTIAVMELGLGWVFIRWLLHSDRGPKEPRKLLLAAALFGVLAVVGAIGLESWLLPKTFLEDHAKLGASSLLGNSFLVGVIEEGCKALPLALFLIWRKKFDEVTDGLIFFGISGMVFGVLEDIGYALRLGPETGIARVLTGPFTHAGFCIITGWAIAAAVVHKQRFWPLVGLAGLAAAISLHGLYDFGLFYGHGWSILMALGITVFVNFNILFVLHLSRKADAKLGIGASGQNLYCRNCGKPNPKHFVYCIYCGKRT